MTKIVFRKRMMKNNSGKLIGNESYFG